MHEQIIDALRQGAHDQAQALARAAIDANPEDVRAHRLMAQALRLGGQHQAALAALDRAIALSPDDAELHFHRAGLLLGSRDVAQARRALDQSLELDPNLFGAYLIQAQIALGTGDLDDAERKATFAARIAPEHPVLHAIQAMITLGRGDKDGALSQVTAAMEKGPGEPEVLNAAAFIYLANGHLAFAEQTFRRLLESHPQHHGLRRILAELLLRQRRPAEALDELEPMLERPEHGSAEARRLAGGIALAAGQPDRALRWLRDALGSMPSDERTLDLAMKAWSQLGDVDGARNALEALLSTSPEVDLLWRARLSVETTPEPRREVLERWLAALPESREALEIEASRQILEGDHEGAKDTLRRLVELAPEPTQAQAGLLNLLATSDPADAVAFAQDLLDARAADDSRPWALYRWLGFACDLAGDHARAVEAWTEGQLLTLSRPDSRLMELPAITDPGATRAIAGSVAPEAPAVALLAGLPGSGVANVARLLDGVVPAFRSDRFSTRPPGDPLQRLHLASDIASGKMDPAEVMAQWRQALPARGLAENAAVIDWLLHWDNALLDAIRPQLPQALVLIALRDPRDMLLDWFSSGPHLPLPMGTPVAGARWLAHALEHIVVLEEQNLQQHAVLRLDDCINSPAEAARLVSRVLGIQLPDPPAGLFGSRRFEAGHWRTYAGQLQDAFAVLSPVAVRLGYPQD